MWRAVPLLTPVLLEGRASLLFIVNLVLVSVLGLHSLVLLLVRGGLVQSVKGCSRREDGGRLRPWRQDGGAWAPFRTIAGEGRVGAEQGPALDLTLRGPWGLRVIPPA